MSGANPLPDPATPPPLPPPALPRRLFAWVLAGLVAILGGLYFLQGVDQRAGPIGRLLGQVVPSGQAILQPPAELRELFEANSQHLQIAMAFGACHAGLDVSVGAAPPVAQALLLNLNPYGGYDYGAGGAEGVTAPALTDFQAAIIRLSDATSRARVQSARVAAEQGARMATFQWAAVIIGAVTTILVGLRSVERIRFPTGLGILAIVFSALGTGCTTVNSFFAPADAFNRADRALAQLRLLHRERAVSMLMGLDPCKASMMDPDQPADARARFVRDWNARLTEIMTVAGASAQTTPGATGPGSSTGGRTPGAGGT